MTAPEGKTEDTRDFLTMEIASGEAVLWHLGHCGFAVRTKNHFLVFDYYPPQWRPASPGLANGFLEADELAGQSVTVFVTHGHRDHFDPKIYYLADIGASFVYGFRPGTAGSGAEQRYTGPEYIYAPPRTRNELGNMVVETISSNDLGVGFLVTIDGVTLYHAGDHAGWREGELAHHGCAVHPMMGLPSHFGFVN